MNSPQNTPPPQSGDQSKESLAHQLASALFFLKNLPQLLNRYPDLAPEEMKVIQTSLTKHLPLIVQTLEVAQTPAYEAHRSEHNQ